MAQEFHLSPLAVARELRRDPSQLALVCVGMLRYAEAHAVYKRANKKELERWDGSKLMDQVKEIDGELAQEWIDAHRGEGE